MDFLKRNLNGKKKKVKKYIPLRLIIIAIFVIMVIIIIIAYLLAK